MRRNSSGRDDESGAEAAGDRRVAAPLQDPALQRNNQPDHQQGHTCQHRRFTIVGDLVPYQRKNLGGVNIKSKGHPQQVFGFKGLKDAQELQRKNRIIGEIIRGRVTLNIVRRLLAPPTRAASSKLASMLRKAGVKSMTLIEIPWPIRFAKTIPGTLKILKRPCAKNRAW